MTAVFHGAGSNLPPTKCWHREKKYKAKHKGTLELNYTENLMKHEVTSSLCIQNAHHICFNSSK